MSETMYARAHLEAEPPSILVEAEAMVNGPRRDTYDHPRNNMRRTAALMTAYLGEQLNAPLRPDQAAMLLVCVKLAREAYKHKHDNLVDMAGYTLVADLSREEVA